MNDGRWERMWEVFHAAVDRPAGARDAFLDAACGDDAALRREVEDLLAHHGGATADLEAPSLATGLVDPDVASGAVGPYRIVETIGEGGMGVVYRARQTEPIERDVALKLIKLGLDTVEVIARFESERQALALMNHPNVARVLDAGATRRGRPYFVMELVDGEPITAWCDRRRLDMRRRLALFRQVCAGVQHAHQRGVIHRDLKPSNVLVQDDGDGPTPKIIDFGIAKATARQLTARTVFTRSGAVIGTPEYMSPEQAGTSGIDVDTRTDVYSLGVVLYELLTGALPFEREELTQAGYDSMCRIIRESDPPRPSTRISSLGARSDATAASRCTDAAGLARALQGDLDWIVLKTLEKDPARRYESASALAADLARHLEDRPVEAGPPGPAYRVRKFVARHRAGVAAAALVVLTVVGGLTATSLALVRARRAEAEARSVSDFLVGLFKVSDPGEARGNSVTARELLDRGAERIEGDLADTPVVQGRLRNTMGNVYLELGLHEEAEPLLVAAHEQLLRRRGPHHGDTRGATNDLALYYLRSARYDQAESLFRETFASGPRFGFDELKVRAGSGLGFLYWRTGRYDEAEPLLVETLETWRARQGDDGVETLNARNNLANLLWERGRRTEALPLFAETLASRRRLLGDDHPQTLRSMNNLAYVYAEMGRGAEAEAIYLEALETRRRVLGPDHPGTLNVMSNLGRLYRDAGRHEEAEPLFLAALEARRAVLGPEHQDTLTTANSLANAYRATGRLQEAEPLYRETLETQRRALGDDHPDTLITASNLGELYLATQRYDEAEKLLGPTAAGQRRVLGEDHPTLGITLHRLACLRREVGKYAAADRLFAEVQQIWEEQLDPSDPRIAENLEQHAELLERMGDHEGARALADRAAALHDAP